MNFDFKALTVNTVVFCTVIPYSLLDANISEEPAATIAMVEEIERFCTVRPSCCIVLGCFNKEDGKVGHIVAGSQHGEHFYLKRREIFSLLHRACCRVTQLLHHLLHIYKIYKIYTLKH